MKQIQVQTSLGVVFVGFTIGFAGLTLLLDTLLHKVEIWPHYVISGVVFAVVMVLIEKYRRWKDRLT